MSEHWLVYLMMAADASIVYWFCDKLQILKSKP